MENVVGSVLELSAKGFSHWTRKKKQVSFIRRYHNHTLQANPRHWTSAALKYGFKPLFLHIGSRKKVFLGASPRLVRKSLFIEMWSPWWFFVISQAMYLSSGKQVLPD